MKTCCAWCHSIFAIKPYKTRKWKTNYCCPEHYGFSQRNKRPVSCFWCKKILYRIPSQINQKVFCSIPHRDQWIKAQRLPRFWKHVIRGTSANDCWAWRGPVLNGYGNLGGIRASRFSYELHFGSIPKGQWVLHTCDNPPCANPQHLKLGTHSDNMKDKVLRGRSNFGERNNLAKLTSEEVKLIKKKCSQHILHSLLAHQFKVSVSCIRKISQKQTWHHLDI